MSRPKKDGLDYFPVDTVFDDKIDAIESIHHNNGIVWVLRFWQKAYRTLTGLVDFNGLFAELFANKCRITIEEHENILKTAVLVDFCHEVTTGVYTSNGIQKRISSVSKERKQAVERQNKVNKSKVKKSKVKECPDYSANNSGITIPEHLKETKNYKERNIYIDEIYALYPSKDINNGNRSTGKNKNDKAKIEKLLREKTVDEIKELINQYVSYQYKTKAFLKNFTTFLNQLPEVPSESSIDINKKYRIIQ